MKTTYPTLRILRILPTLRILPALIAIILLLTLACTRRPLHQPTYDRVSRIIDSLPDQALAILDSIPTSELQPGLDSARYILLHATAENKTHQLTTDTVALNYAIRVFENLKKRDDLRYALYLIGRINYENEEYPASLTALIKSEQLIDDDTPDYHKALIYHSLSDYCNTTMNGHDALEYIQKALDCYEKADKPLHAEYAKIDKATYLNNYAEYGKAKVIFQEVENYASINKDTILLGFCYDGLSRSFAGLMDYPMALTYVHKLEAVSDTLDSQTSAILAFLEANAGDINKADSISKALITQGDSWGTYGMLPSQPQNEQLLEAYIKRDNETSQTLLDIYQSKYPSEIRKSLNMQKFHLKYKLQNRQYFIWLLLLVATGLSGLIACIILYFRKKTRVQQAKYERLSEELVLFKNMHEVELSRLAGEGFRNSSRLLSILQKYTSTVDLMTRSYKERMKQKENKDRLSALMAESIKEIQTNNEIIEEIEAFVNLKNNNVIARLKEEIPDLEERKIKLFTLIAVGFSPLTISEIMKVSSADYVGVMKYRLKHTIIENKPSSIKDFLRILK